MGVTVLLSALLLLASPAPDAPMAPSPSPTGPLILFLVDNSASLPALDPDEKRVAALEKMFTFLQGQPYRLILFGGRREIYVDDASRYNNRGQWTDFYFAFDKVREVIKTYPAKTEFRIILLTDGILDPAPADWQDMTVPPGADLKAHVVERLIDLVKEIHTPLYVILVGDPPVDGKALANPEQAPGLILDLVRAANGAMAAPTAQSLSSFFKDDGLLLKKFVFRVAPHEGLAKVEPVVRRIVASPRAGVELQFLSLLVLPLTLFLFLLLGLLVRSFPGPGDTEVIELARGVAVHVGADRLWASQGLTLVGDAKEATASFTYQTPAVDLTGAGLDTSGLDPLTLRLLPLDVEELRRALENYSDHGTKEEKIYALNLDYMSRNFDAALAERLLTSPTAERRRVPPLDFIRAKAHLLSNEELRQRLTEARVHMVQYGKASERRDLVPGEVAKIGRYGFIVRDVLRGGRKEVRLVLHYDRVPSLLGLKTILPDFFQRVFRLRRSNQRIVT